ncbi:MAG TPA: hypothetical protein VFT67_05335, partial [Jatrophihabitantaceae bacterium]|nr:hypothetical protein [Jatrophihabitantaceae bacterium]
RPFTSSDVLPDLRAGNPGFVLTRIVLPWAGAQSVNVPAAADLVAGEARYCEDRADYYRDHAEDPDDVHRGNEADDEEDYP